MRGFLAVLLVIFLFGCTEHRVDESIKRYQEVAPKVHIGDSEQKVLALLQPTQKGLPAKALKKPEQYLEDSGLQEVYYFRSSRTPDGMTTDDEFTPYIFENRKLVAVGWNALQRLKEHDQMGSLITSP
jgi:hypothetical protein